MNARSHTLVTTDKFMPIQAKDFFSVPFTTQHRESPENGQGISRQEDTPQRGGRVSLARVSVLNNSPEGLSFWARQGMRDTCQRSSRPTTSALLCNDSGRLRELGEVAQNVKSVLSVSATKGLVACTSGGRPEQQKYSVAVKDDSQQFTTTKCQPLTKWCDLPDLTTCVFTSVGPLLNGWTPHL